MTPADLLGYLGAILGICIVIFIALHKKFDYLSPLGIFLAVMIMHWVIWPLYTVMSIKLSTFSLSSSPNSRILDASFGEIAGIYAYAVVSILVFTWFFKYTNIPILPKKILFPRGIYVKKNKPFKLSITFLGFIATWAAFLLLAQSKGGILFYLTNIDSIRNNNFRGVAPYFYALQLGLLLLTYSVIDAWINSKRKVIIILVASIGFLPCLLIGQRIYVLYLLMFALGLYNYGVKKINLNYKFILYIASFAFLNIAFIAFKTVGFDIYSLSASGEADKSVAILGLGFLISRFSAAETLLRMIQINGISHIGDFGISAMFDIFMSLVPSFLRESYVTLGQKFNLDFYPELSGIGSGIAAALPYFTGDGYSQWGILGALVYPTMIAIFFKNIYSWFLRDGLESLHIYTFYSVQLFVFTEIQSNALMNIFVFLIFIHSFLFARQIILKRF